MRLRPERGASAVEAALVTPVFMLLLFGILEFGFYFKDALSVNDAVKAGVRVASAEPRVASYAQDAADRVQEASGALDRSTIQELWVYKANTANNFPEGQSSFATCTTCTKFVWDGSSFVQTTSTWPATTHDACSASPPDRIGVYLKARHQMMTTFVVDSLPAQQADVLRFEPVPERSGCKP